MDATVRNVSAGGLSVQIDQPAEQGETLSLTLNPDRRSEIKIQGIVWSVRRFKVTSGKTAQYRLGLVLSEAPDSYLELLPTPKSKPRKSKPTPLLREERMPEV